MSHWRLVYHILWATRGREPLLDAAMARTLGQSIRATGHEHRAVMHAVGIMPDHVHVVVSIPPSIAIATFVGRLKGSASHLLNNAHEHRVGDVFAWQAEYGVYSFGEKALPDVVAYIENQPARHAANRLWPDLEQDASLAPPKPSSD